MRTEPKYKNRSWLREQYIQKGKTMNEIAEMADCAHGTVFRWMERFEIERKGNGNRGGIQKDDNTVRITAEKAEYIRDNMDMDNQELQEETELTEYAIDVIKEAKRNKFWKEE